MCVVIRGGHVVMMYKLLVGGLVLHGCGRSCGRDFVPQVYMRSSTWARRDDSVLTARVPVQSVSLCFSMNIMMVWKGGPFVSLDVMA